jgi:excisionase family DNA binding protein
VVRVANRAFRQGAEAFISLSPTRVNISPMSATEKHQAQPRDSAGRYLHRLPEVRALLSCSRSTVDRLIEAGELPVVWVRSRRYIASDDLQAFIDRNRDLQRLGSSAAFGRELRRLAEHAPAEVKGRLLAIADATRAEKNQEMREPDLCRAPSSRDERDSGEGSTST